MLNNMKAFRSVVIAGSFAKAARSLGMTTAWVSKQIKQLEEHLGTQLLIRTTRKISVTEAGKYYFEKSGFILEEIDELEKTLDTRRQSLSGKLRISVPMSYGLIKLTDLIIKFHNNYPELELDVIYTDSFSDLIEDNVDVAIRLNARLEDSSLIVKKISEGERVLSASVNFFKNQRLPAHPRDLEHHNCLKYSFHTNPGQWTFKKNNETVTVNIKGPIQFNNSLALKEAAIQGAGLLLTPDFVIENELKQKKLKKVLTSWKPTGYSVFAIMPPSKYSTRKTKTFVEFLTTELKRK